MGLTRLQLFKSLGAVKSGPDLDKHTKTAYEQLEETIWRGVQQKYATSFWASNFPIDEKSCGRMALYNLLNIPSPAPMSPHGRAVTEMGKAAEYQIVYRWGKAGYTIGGSMPLHYGDNIEQLALEDNNTWLSGNLDAVLDLRPGYDSVLPVDIKSKSDEVIRKMKVALLSYENKHYAQVQAYIYLCNLYHAEMGWDAMGLEPACGASLFYVSRENPRNTYEFYFKANWPLINLAIERLKAWKEDFIFDRLPARDTAWKWSEEPCKWCEKKKFACKPDNKNKIENLSKSGALEWAGTIRNYSLPIVKEKVLGRWT